MARLPDDFKNLSPAERRKELSRAVDLSFDETEALRRPLYDDEADALIESAIGSLSLPLGIARNFVVNGKNVLVPMATEECSTVAAASFGAKLALPHGFSAKADKQIMQGTIQIVGEPDPEAAVREIKRLTSDILKEALSEPGAPLITHGGGLKWLIPSMLNTKRGPMILVDLFVDCVDSMGANAVDEYAERIARSIKRFIKGKVRLRILTNLCIHRLAASKTVLSARELGRGDLEKGRDIIEGFLDAQALADSDIFRAATHNKGIMNGIDAVLVATGNDWRAAEAGAHAQAACVSEDRDLLLMQRSAASRYRSLTRYALMDKNALSATLEIPLALGVVGGATNSIPVAPVCRKIMGVRTAHELAEIAVSVGLAQNIAALRALVTEGIQRGHMHLHRKKNSLKKSILTK